MSNKRYIASNCKNCNKDISIRSDYIKKHSYLCRSCINKKSMTKERIDKIKLINTGKKQSEETRLKKSLSLKGRKRPIEVIEKIRKGNIGKKWSEDRKIKFGKIRTGKSTSLKGRTLVERYGIEKSNEIKKKISDSHHTEEFVKKYHGKNMYNWKGRPGSLKYNIRLSPKYKEWRKEVFNRDNYKCRFCDINNKLLEVHHIIRFSLVLDMGDIKSFDEAMNYKPLWDIRNGVTLCQKCHSKLDKYRKIGDKL